MSIRGQIVRRHPQRDEEPDVWPQPDASDDRRRIVKYMLLIHSGATDAAGGAVGCTPEDWMRYDQTVREAGILVDSHSLADLVTATTVRVSAEGERTVTDGPFAETREVLGGYYVIDVPDLDVAIDWAARCPGSLGGGSVVVRPIADFGA
jgi:hypothetical protein